jgi:soluble lytic murein transglycosylase-like protein
MACGNEKTAGVDVHAFLEAAPRCLPARLARWAREIGAAALATGVDPFLLAAIMDRESLGGEYLKPRGPAGVGDGGHGRGLMQVDDRYHASFVAALYGRSTLYLWQDPAFACLYGARLLEENMARFGGDELAAVAAYNASSTRVSATRANLPPGASEAQRLAAMDSLTTDGDYVSDVLARRAGFLAALLPSPR